MLLDTMPGCGALAGFAAETAGDGDRYSAALPRTHTRPASPAPPGRDLRPAQAPEQRSRFRNLLRSRLGDDVTISVGQMHIFLYTGSAKAADEAGQVARALLEEQGRRLVEARLERWDSSGEEWRDPGEPIEPEDKPEPG